ncbi:MAG: hypothetical protein NTX52_05170, partial [Planctomycetota bacterium]|nr:hypothetical protein [Planctomycetota bacterium]
MKYLEIHSEKDGKRMFGGASTRYDWYVLQKAQPTGKTIVKGQDEDPVPMDLRNWEFIPNAQFGLVKKLLAHKPEDRVEIINDRSAYGADKKWVANEKDAEHVYPCVYMVRKNNELVLKWSSRNDRGHFGIPKVIYAGGAGTGFWVDSKGIGMTQW